MLKPYEMSSVIITGPNSVQENVIKELHEMKILHIVDHSKSEFADIGKPLQDANMLSEILVKARALISALGIKKEDSTFNPKKGLADVESATRRLNDEVSIIHDELRKTEESIQKLQAAKQELEILSSIDIPIEALSPCKSLSCFTGYLHNRNSVIELRQELSNITHKFSLFDGIAGKRAFVAVFINESNKDNAYETLQKIGFSPVDFASIANLKGSAPSNLKKMEQESVKLFQKRDELQKRIEKITNEHKGFLIAAEEFLSEQLEKAEAPLKFASTQSSFLIKGWIPSIELKNSIERLNKAAKNRIFVHFEPAKKEDNVPVKLNNPAFVKPFEFFIDLYSMPSYKELDPTFFIFLTFPIFFGIMLGDVGYGIASLIVFYILKKKMPKARRFFNILILASFATMIFGILFGEFFGYEFIHPMISREKEMFKLLYIAIAIGIVHVNIGLIVGFINESKSHGLLHAVYAKASWIVLETGIAMLALSYFGKIVLSPLVGAAFLALAILLLFKGEGVKGLIELPSIFTNIMSYARLMAIGLSSVILAVITNDSSKEFFQKGGFYILIGILILAIGHAINIMLGLLGSFLHSLRLHYVEFFSKFFHGGAKRYQPFGMKEE